MRIIFFGKGKRGLVCLQKLQQEKEDILLIICQQNDPFLQSFEEFAKESKIEIFCPGDPNEPSSLNKLESLDTDLFILAGYGMILEDYLTPFLMQNLLFMRLEMMFSIKRKN